MTTPPDTPITPHDVVSYRLVEAERLAARSRLLFAAATVLVGVALVIFAVLSLRGSYDSLERIGRLRGEVTQLHEALDGASTQIADLTAEVQLLRAQVISLGGQPLTLDDDPPASPPDEGPCGPPPFEERC